MRPAAAAAPKLQRAPAGRPQGAGRDLEATGDFDSSWRIRHADRPVFSDFAESAHFLLETVGEDVIHTISRFFYKYCGVEVPPRARAIRTVFAELERLRHHAAATTGICNSTALAVATSQAAQTIRLLLSGLIARFGLVERCLFLLEIGVRLMRPLDGSRAAAQEIAVAFLFFGREVESCRRMGDIGFDR
jgi:hypothetical protein